MKIAVDAMGGDYAPQEIVAGSVEAVKDLGIPVILVGPEPIIRQELSKHTYPKDMIEIEHAEEIIAMDDHPATAVREKKNSSLLVANRLVKEGRASAVISAGNSGAAMAASLMELRRIPGIARPAITIPLPTLKGISVLLDAGANADCDPEYLVQFAVMGSIYVEKVLGCKFPKVALLNIGEEETKGNKMSIEAHQLLKKAPINFIGNIEGKDLLSGVADVIVCDGFVGNIALKLVEGVAYTFYTLMKSTLKSNPVTAVAGAIIKPSLKKNLWSKMDYSEYGGAILLGVNGVSMISHGRSNAKAIRNAIRAAKQAVMEGVVGVIPNRLTGPVAGEDENAKH